MDKRSLYLSDCGRVIIQIHKPVPNAHLQKTKQNNLSEYHTQMRPNDFRRELQKQSQIHDFWFSPDYNDCYYDGDYKGYEPFPDV